MKFITNPIKHTLLKYNLIDNKNLLLISKRTRDKKIRVFQDKKSKIIFLEKQSTQNDYAKIKYNDFEVKNFYKTKIINNKKLKVKMLRGDDIKRRLKDYYNLYKNAMFRAKQSRKEAIKLFLEAKNIKTTHMLNDIDDSEEEEEFYNNLNLA